MRYQVLIVAVMIAAWTHTAAWSQAHPDIELDVVGGQVTVAGPHSGEIWHSVDAASSFVEVGASNLFSTIFPGSETDQPVFTPSVTQVSYEPLSRLWYWSPTGGGFADSPNGEIVEMAQGSIDRFQLTSTGISVVSDLGNDGLAFVGTANGSGGYHGHLSFSLFVPGLGSDPAAGAYLTSMRVVTSDLGQTDPVWLLWNQGLGEGDFAAAIGAAEAFVPEPATLAIVSAASVGLMLRRRRNRCVGA